MSGVKIGVTAILVVVALAVVVYLAPIGPSASYFGYPWSKAGGLTGRTAAGTVVSSHATASSTS